MHQNLFGIKKKYVSYMKIPESNVKAKKNIPIYKKTKLLKSYKQ